MPTEKATMTGTVCIKGAISTIDERKALVDNDQELFEVAYRQATDTFDVLAGIFQSDLEYVEVQAFYAPVGSVYPSTTVKVRVDAKS